MNQDPQFLEELLDFLRIPSVSTLPEHRPDIARAADWTEAALRRAGLRHVEQIRVGEGHPLVFGRREDSPGAPTVLFYGHYDVQPADPLEEWESPPFEPEVREGRIFARGASDDKGQMATHLFALRRMAARWGDRWPVNVKVLVEGEEEAGGAAIEAWAPANRERLAADFVLVSDTAFVRHGLPSIDYGLRGIAYAEIEVLGPSRDLHSGIFGGGVMNPLSALARILDRLVDLESGRVRIPGFYDDVLPITERDRALAAEVPFSEKEFLRSAGVDEAWGEEGYGLYERLTGRPTLDINGVTGGFRGAGAKTVIPARAAAKVSMRLVPDQDPGRILDALCAYVGELAPRGVRVRCRRIYEARGVLLNTENPWLAMAREAMAEAFGRRPVLTRCGASIPVAAVFAGRLGMDVIFMGFGLPDDRLHSPNEKFDLAQFYGGIRAVAGLLERMAATRKEGGTG